MITVFDVNFMQAGASAESQTFIDNLIAYMTNPIVIVIPTPTLGEWGLIALTLMLIGMGYFLLRRRTAAQVAA